MADPPPPQQPQLVLTEEQKQRIETNRLQAIAKRKALILSSQQQQQQQLPNYPPHPTNQNPYFRPFKCRKLSYDIPICNKVEYSNNNINNSKFRAKLEICSPDSFSITPESVQGFTFPGQDHCFWRLQDCLANVMHTHFTQIPGDREASVYKLRDYDAVLKCLKNFKDIEVEEIPWKTYNVVEKVSHSFISGRWIPCRPEHLTAEQVREKVQKLPRKLLDTLLPFQLEGLEFGLRRGGRCLIADEMGLGKTLQAISIASCFADEGAILVVCPAILRYTWAEELERWLPSYLPSDIHLVFGRRNNPLHLTSCPKVVVISYTMLHRLQESMMKLKWAVLIVDESHHVRCSKKKVEPREITAVLNVASKTERIVLLSGTPSLSRPFDIYHQINMLWPGLLGKNKFEFAKTYCSIKFVKDSQGNTFQNFSGGTRLQELNVLLRQTVMIRRMKEHLLVELPPKRRQIITLSLKKLDIDLAKKAVDVLEDSSPVGYANEDEGENDISEDNSHTKLTPQVLGIAKVSGFLEWLSLHPILTDVEDTSNAEINDSCQKMIIFAHHHKVLDRLQEFLCNKGIGFIRVDGNTPDSDRPSAVKSFQSLKEIRVAIIGIQVGYAGLDLSVAQNVVILELPKDFNSLSQAEDRAHRRGQKNAVNIYIFCAKDTSDELRWRRLNRSARCVSSTVDGKYDAVTEIKVDSVTDMQNVAACQTKLSESAPSSEEHFADGTGQKTEVPIDGKEDENLCETQQLNVDEPVDLEKAHVAVHIDALRFTVSQYTGRIHLCTCNPGEDSKLIPLAESFRPEDIIVDHDDIGSGFIKENPACRNAILTFVDEWRNLNRMDKKKLFGKPLKLPLAIELLRYSESVNHDSKGLLKGGSKRRHTPLCDLSYPLESNVVMKEVYLSDGNRKKKKKAFIQFRTLEDEPLCKLCQKPYQGVNAKKPKDFLDLFCTLVCYEEYCSRTSGTFLRQELFEIERGVCTNCELDCHKLVQHLKPLSREIREKYIEREAPRLAKNKKLLAKLVHEPTEGNAWHADHKVAVYLGGGECRVENMRTLCVACHAEVTAAQLAERCLARKLLKKTVASYRKDRKGRTMLKDQGPSVMEEKEDDDVQLLVNVPGSAYSEPKQDDKRNGPSDISPRSE